MSAKVKLVTARSHTENNITAAGKDVISTNWKLCCLCQKDVCPSNSRACTNGYQSLAINLLEFQKVNSIPMNDDLARLDDGEGISETLVQHKALYHKSCYLKFANDKLKRAQKRAPDSPLQSSLKKTRNNTDTSTSETKCFFCDQDRWSDA